MPAPTSSGGPMDRLRDRVVGTVAGLFAHADPPLARTLDHPGDAGLHGPDSVTWRVLGDACAFIGGLRALIIQAAHPEVVAGVADHSSFRDDPLGRLSRTSNYVTAVSFGSMPEVEAAISAVRRAHGPVRGESHRGRSYRAGDPSLAAWVHNVLTSSFLAAYRHFGPHELSQEDADRFVREQTRVGRLLGADPLPETASELDAWIVDHPELATSPGARDAMRFLGKPPLRPAVRVGYRVVHAAATSTVPPRIRDLLDIEARPGAEKAGRAMISGLRWALGSSPSWHVSLVRVGAPVPPGLFRQPLPVAGGDEVLLPTG